MKASSYAASLSPTLDKERMLAEMTTTESILASQEKLLDNLAQFEKNIFKKYKSNRELQSFKPRALTVLKQALGRKDRRLFKALYIIHPLRTRLMGTIVDIVQDTFPNTIVTTKATLIQLNVVALADMLDLYARYLSALIVFTLYEIVNLATTDDKYEYNKQIFDYLTNNERSFSMVLTATAPGIRGIEKMLTDLPDAIVELGRDDVLLQTYAKTISISAVHQASDGFIGNPIYHVIKWISDVTVNRVVRQREERSQVEVLKIAVVAELERNPSPAARDELDNINDRLAILNRKITNNSKGAI